MSGDTSLANKNEEYQTAWFDDDGGLFEMEVYIEGPHKNELTGWTRHKGQEWPIWNFKLGIRKTNNGSEFKSYRKFRQRLSWWARLREKISHIFS